MSDNAELLKRLEAKEVTPAHGGGVHSWSYINPDGPKAIKAIRALEARVAKLEKALGEASQQLSEATWL